MLARERVMIAPDEGAVILGGGVGFVGKLYGEENGGAFAIGEHPLESRILAAPPHTHTRMRSPTYSRGRSGSWSTKRATGPRRAVTC